MSHDYTVRLPVFEGPLDLLLHLIKVNELDITEIALAEVTGQYLEYLRLMETLDLDVAGDFLLIAATLIHMKLRSLLPDPEPEEPESEDEDQFLSARALLQQLIEYRKYKEAAAELARREELQALTFVREVALPTLAQAEHEPQIEGDLRKLLDAFARVLRFVERRGEHKVRGEPVTVEEKLTEVRRRLLLDERLDACELFAACATKIEMIVLLIALLELCRLKEAAIEQPRPFDAIVVRRRVAPATSDAAPEEAPSTSDALDRPPTVRIIEVPPDADASGGVQEKEP